MYTTFKLFFVIQKLTCYLIKNIRIITPYELEFQSCKGKREKQSTGIETNQT